MPFYRYTAEDASGKSISGALDATSPEVAYGRLTGMGLGQVWVEGATPGTAVVKPGPVAPQGPILANRPGPIHSGPAHPGSTRPTSAPAARAATPTAARTANPPATVPRTMTPPQAAVRTEAPVSPAIESFEVPIASAKDRAFFFDQLGRFINSGIGASRAYETLGDQLRGRSGEFLRTAARKTAQGVGMGEALRGGYVTEAERDALTAGERGGYVPQACSRLSDLAMDAHRLGRGIAYPIVMIALALFAGPCTRGVQDGSLKAIELQDRAGGTLSPMGTMIQEWKRTAPTTVSLGLLLVGLFFLAIKVWNLPFNRALRHRSSLGLWPLGPRARSEGMSQLSSHLAALASAGIPPNETARLAAATIPNLVLREETMRHLGNVPNGVPLSQAISRSSLVTLQHRNMVENGELTGDVPGALSMVARVEEGEYRNRSKFAGKGIFLILMIVASIGTAVYLGFTARYWYSHLIELLTRGD